MNSLYEENIRKDITEEYKCESEFWMSTETDDKILEYWRLPKDEYIVKLKQNDG